MVGSSGVEAAIFVFCAYGAILRTATAEVCERGVQSFGARNEQLVVGGTLMCEPLTPQ